MRRDTVGKGPDGLRLYGLVLGEIGAALAAGIRRARNLRRWRGARPHRLLFAPQDLRTADPTVARDIHEGTVTFAGRTVATGGLSPFAVPSPSAAWSEALYGFGWLRHLRAADTALARDDARALVAEAVGRRRRRALDEGPARRTPVVARRLISFLCQSPMILGGADHEVYGNVLRAIGASVAALERDMVESRRPADRLAAAIALSYASLCCSGIENRLRRATRILSAELDRQILADGGHESRHPGALIEILLDLLPLRLLYQSRGLEAPDALARAVERAMPMLRALRHGSGDLALMNGMGRTPLDHLATLLSYDETRGRLPPPCGPSGYARLAAGATVVIADVGRAPPLPAARFACAGPLSFELSDGPHRIVVNAGVPAGDGPGRQDARRTDAQATLTIGTDGAGTFLADGRGRAARFLLRRLGPVLLPGPSAVDASLDGGGARDLVLTARHDAFLARYGVTHERRLSLSPDGSRLAGTDALVLAAGRPGPAAETTVRFPLHPAVTVAAGEGAGTARLVAADGTAWRFTAETGLLAIEAALFHGGADGARATRRLVLRHETGPFDRTLELRWRLEREPPG